MSVVDLHPEELLEKEARGELDSEDRRRLAEHLAHCATCEFERRLRADFALELASDAPVRASLGSRLPRFNRSRVRRSWRARTAWPAVAAVMLAVSAASASNLVPRWRVVVSTALRAIGVTAVAVTSARPTSQAPGPMASSASVAVPAPAVVDVLPVSAPSSDAAVVVRHVVRPATPSATAASLFDEASAARRRGDYTAAFALHHDLESKFPGSREAQESRGAMARLLLDRGDDAAAMDMFESYLNAGGGGLREEAMAGRAEALDRLGRSVDARRAWQELLEAFPLTTYADHARARMSGPSDP